MAPHSSTFAWKIPWTEEPGRLQSMGSLESDTTERLHFHFSLSTFMHWRWKRQPTTVFLPGESQGWGALLGCRLWGRTESDMTERLNWLTDLYVYLSIFIGEGDSTPLQYSCLENPMDGGAWWAAVHGVSKSRTRLSDFTFTFHFPALEKEMATHSSILAWRIPGTGEPGGLPSRVAQSRTQLKQLSSSSSSCTQHNIKLLITADVYYYKTSLVLSIWYIISHLIPTAMYYAGTTTVCFYS